jgi:hypothetical protein
MNQRCRGGKLLNMVVIFVGCFVLGDDPNIVLFLLYNSFLPEPLWVILFTSL